MVSEEANFMSEFVIDDIVHVDIFENFGDGYPLDKLSRDWFGLIYNVGAREKIIIDGKTFETNGGSTVFFRQHERYRIEFPDNYIKC